MTDFSDLLLVSDFDRTLTAPDSSIPPANLEAIRRFMEKGGLVIEIYEAEEGEKLPGAIDHIALDVEDLDALHAYAVEKGFNIVEEGSLPFWDNGIRYFTVLGPNNEKVEFSEML